MSFDIILIKVYTKKQVQKNYRLSQAVNVLNCKYSLESCRVQIPEIESKISFWERSGSVVECLTRDQGVAGSTLTGVTVLWSFKARHIYPSLVPVQPRKTRPCLNERLLMGRKESNQNQTSKYRIPLQKIFNFRNCRIK